MDRGRGAGQARHGLRRRAPRYRTHGATAQDARAAPPRAPPCWSPVLRDAPEAAGQVPGWSGCPATRQPRHQDLRNQEQQLLRKEEDLEQRLAAAAHTLQVWRRRLRLPALAALRGHAHDPRCGTGQRQRSLEHRGGLRDPAIHRHTSHRTYSAVESRDLAKQRQQRWGASPSLVATPLGGQCGQPGAQHH